MKIYIIGFLFSLFFAGIAEKSKVSSFFKNILLALSMLPLLLIAIFRYNVGTDYLVYSSKQIPQVIYNLPFRSIEPLYIVIIKIGHYLNNNTYFWIFALTHIIIISICYVAIIKNSSNYFWSQFIFIFSTFYNISLNMMRQSIAIAIFYLATQYIYKKKIIPYFISIYIACLFHTTAFIFFPLYFISRIDISKITTKRISLIIILFSFLSLPMRSLINFVMDKIPKYSVYNGNKYDNFSNSVGSMFNIYTIISLVCLYFILINLKKIKKESIYPEKTVLFIVLLVITVIISMYQPVIPNANRIIYSAFFSLFLVIPYFIRLLPFSTRIIYKFLIIILFVGVYINTIIIHNSGETVPYYSIFENNKFLSNE